MLTDLQNSVTAENDIKFATKRKFSLHLTYVAALPWKFKSPNWSKLQKNTAEDGMVCDKKEASHIIWLNAYYYCHTNCSTIHNLAERMIKDDPAAHQLHCH